MISNTEALGTVYVIQRARPRTGDGWEPNLQPATDYGRLDFVFDATVRAYIDPRAAALRAEEKLASFDPANDFLLALNQGDPACTWTVIMFLVKKGHTRLRYLYWSRGKIAGGMSNENGFYMPVEVDLSRT